jgi:uncharacterized phage protein (TIGR01671 family)
MREIKFRAWDKSEKLMCPAEVINFQVGGCFLIGNGGTPGYAIGRTIYPAENRGHFVEFDDVYLMQFTGLRDKNGVEVYDGDEIEITWGDPDETSAETITWDNDYAYWKYGNNPMYELFDSPIISFEVIGNIYSNPELLNP